MNFLPSSMPGDVPNLNLFLDTTTTTFTIAVQVTLSAGGLVTLTGVGRI